MTDDELFSELQRLVSVPWREPPESSVAALHRAVESQFGPRRSRASWKHRLGLAAVAFGLVAGAPAAAFASGLTPLPDPLRTAMHSIGLPVDSVPVSDTRSAEAALQDALRRRDRAEELRAAARLQASLSFLDGTDRARMEGRADALLDQVSPAATSAERAGVPSASEPPERPGPEPGPGAVTGSTPSPPATEDGGSGSGEDRSPAPTGTTVGAGGGQPESPPGGQTSAEPSGGGDSPDTTAPAAGPVPATTTTVPDATAPSAGDSSTGEPATGSGGTDSEAAATTTTTTTTTVGGD